jgi:tetratricopeptide (TPR) repeat protein
VNSWDLFFSYRRHDLERARPLLVALANAGIRVWRDESDIPELSSITSGIREALANCKVFLAFYSITYPDSDACQQEIIAAWIAAARPEGSAANSRVWIVNPETSVGHIPLSLRDRQLAHYTHEEADTLAAHFRSELDELGDAVLGSGPPKPPVYYGMSPVASNRFVGRVNELWDLHGKVTASRIGIITGVYGQSAAQVRGLGGNGKSMLAREYSIRFGLAYPGGVFWLRAYGHDDTKGAVDSDQRDALRQDQIQDFAIRLGIGVEGLRPLEIEASFWRVIEQRNEPCLWIVDDLPSGLDTEEVENKWHARAPLASTLITTRSKEYGMVGQALDLGVLSPDAAFTLLCSRGMPTTGAEERAAHEIIALLGFHPLALEVAGAYLAQRIESFENFLRALQEPHQDAIVFGELIDESLPTGHERSIGITLLRSVLQLEGEGLDLLRLASTIAVAPMTIDFLVEIFNVLGDDGKIRLLKALDQTQTLSLSEISGDGARSVHVLVSRTMRFQFGSEARTQAMRTAAVQVLLTRFARTDYIGYESAAVMDMPHARNLVAGDLVTEQEIDLASYVAWHDHERGNYRQSFQLQQRVVAVARCLLGEDHPNTLKYSNGLAQTMGELGDLAAARKCQERLLEATRRLFGEHDSRTFIASVGLAQILNYQGDLAEARELYERALAIRDSTRSPEDRITLAAVVSLATTLRRLGDLDEARKLQEWVVAVSRSVLGEDNLETVTAINNLATTLFKQGHQARARKMWREVLEARRRIQGEEHPYTLVTKANLAAASAALGDLSDARKIAEDVLQVRRRVLGAEHPDTLASIETVIRIAKDQDDLVEGRRLGEELLRLRERVLGAKHPDTMAAIETLAQTLKHQGDLSQARELQAQLLTFRREVGGTDDALTLRAESGLATTLYDLGELTEARELEERLVTVMKRDMGDEHPETLSAVSNLAMTLYKQGDLAGARKLQSKVLASRSRLFGDQHQDTLNSMDVLAQTLRRLGERKAAIKLEKRSEAAFRRMMAEISEYARDRQTSGSGKDAT